MDSWYLLPPIGAAQWLPLLQYLNRGTQYRRIELVFGSRPLFGLQQPLQIKYAYYLSVDLSGSDVRTQLFPSQTRHSGQHVNRDFIIDSDGVTLVGGKYIRLCEQGLCGTVWEPGQSRDPEGTRRWFSNRPKSPAGYAPSRRISVRAPAQPQRLRSSAAGRQPFVHASHI